MAFSSRTILVIDHTKCGSSDSTDFPVLVSLSGPTLATVANGGQVVDSAGADILFYSDFAGSTQIASEVEYYDGVSGVLVAWVKIGTLSHTADTMFFLFYGNGSPPSRTTGVWSNGFVGVYHLSENAANTAINDSTGTYNLAATRNTSLTTTRGIVAGGQNYTGSTDWAKGAGPNIGFPMTCSGWAYATSFIATPIMSNDTNTGTGSTGWGIVRDMPGSQLALDMIATGGLANTDFTTLILQANKWCFFAVSLDVTQGTTVGYLALLTDTSVATESHSVANAPIGTPSEIWVGSAGAALKSFGGLLDEIRFANVVRSADWITAEFNNQSSPNTFLSIGPTFGRTTGDSMGGEIVLTRP